MGADHRYSRRVTPVRDAPDATSSELRLSRLNDRKSRDCCSTTMAEMLLLVALELGWYSVTLRGAVRDKLDWAGSCQGEADGFGWVDPARREREKKEKRKKKKVSPGQDAGKR